MGTTPKFLIPYAEPGDAVANFPATDKAAALAVEAAVGAIAPFGYATHGTPQAIPTATYTRLNLTLSTQQGGVVVTSNQLVVPATGAGLYLTTGWLTFASGGTGIRTMGLQKGPTNQFVFTGGLLGATISFNFVLRLVAGDTVGVVGFQNSGADLNTAAASGNCGFQMTRVAL
jgi:hypothetical protein